MRTALIGRAILAPPDQDKLARQLARLLPGTAMQHERFIGAAAEAVDCYRKLHWPGAQERAGQENQLAQLEDAARSYLKAVSVLSPSAWDRLRQKQFFVLRKEGRSTDPPLPPRRLTVDSAQWARITADAAQSLIEELHLKRRPGPKRDTAVSVLLCDLARAYGSIFGERPSAYRNGVFQGALAAIGNAYRLPLDIDERRLKSLLERELPSSQRPSRGRKRRKLNHTNSPEKI
jgi:hypothetical protein